MSQSTIRSARLLLTGCATMLVAALTGNAQIVIERTEIADPIRMPGPLGRGEVKTGTGRISGRVVAAETGAPLRRAQVRIMAGEIGVRAALTDTDGRYEFKDLPAGRFSLSASKAGYVSVQYGQTRPFESGRPIELADKQAVDKADFVLPRGGVIAGRILDEFGEPVADAMVMPLRQTWAAGRRRLLPTGRSAQTNDLGQYRLYGLPPGEYYVSATLRNAEMMMVDFALAGGGPAPSGSQPASGYAPTYFPGTSAVGSAQRIEVTVGQEAHNTDFALLPVRLARISGTVLSSEGRAVEGAMVMATPANRSGEVGLPMMGASGRTSRDGQFTISGVAPGDYVLNVRPLRIVTAMDGGDMMVQAKISGDTSDAETGSLPITVAGEDLANVLIVTAKGASVAGRLIFEGSSTPPSAASIRINAMSVELDAPFGGGGASAKADGSFELRGLSGRRLIRAANLPPGWMVKAVRLNGEDVTDTGVEFKPGQEVSGLEIVATPKVTHISGSVTAVNGSLVRDCTVLLFSDDPQHWQLPLSRWVTGQRPNQEGRFEVRGMPAGSYYAAAVEYVEEGAWGDPELLDRLRAHAQRFTVSEGGRETLDLKLTAQY